MKISILGSGAFGTSMAILLSQKSDLEIYLWSPFESEVYNLTRSRQHSALKGTKISEKIQIISNLELAVDKSEIIIIATPSSHVRETSHKLKEFWDNQLIVSVSKGIEQDSLLRMSEVVESEIPGSTVAAISGPSHAEEVARLMPTACVVAHSDLKVAEYLKGILESPNFKLITSTDKIGVELGGALKNVIALAAGIGNGIGFGDNAIAALVTLGISEISRIGAAVGADPKTFFGLSGIGDIIVTSTSKHSRNRHAGILIGNKKKINDVISEVGAVVEGIDSTKAAHQLCQQYNIDAPLLKEIYTIIFEKKPARELLDCLMSDRCN